MTELAQPLETANATIERERLRRLLALATFIIFFQGYMVARSFLYFQQYCTLPTKPPD
jgi:hypothetical protein